MIPSECHSWANSWRVHYLSRSRPAPDILVTKLETVLAEQTANRLATRHQHGKEWEDYGESLDILAKELAEARKIVPEDVTLDWYANSDYRGGYPIGTSISKRI